MYEYDLANASTTGLGKTKSDSPIFTELQRMDEVIMAISKQVERLGTKIAPSLSHTPRSERNEVVDGMMGGSELTATIVEKRLRLQRISDEISTITNECEL